VAKPVICSVNLMPLVVEEGALAPVPRPGEGSAVCSEDLVTGAGAPSSTNRSASGIRFTEQMKGFAALGVDDPQTGHDQGKENRDRLMFELTIAVDDVDRFVAEPEHGGTATGHVESDLLGGRLEVERGWFNLFVEADDPDQREMLYRLWLTGPGGNPMTFVGAKHVRDEGGLDVWRDTSTLFVRILEGHVEPGGDEGVVVGAGIIKIHIPDFMKQLTTFRTSGEHPARAREGVGKLFLGQLWEVYGRFFSRDDDEEERA
jgi:cholesterol oxidase